MTLPSLATIEQLHQRYAPTPAVLELVYTHCQIVRDIALQLIDTHHISVDRQLVEAGCLLHDIGVYTLFTADGIERSDLHYITHGIRGAEILQREGLPAPIVRYADHHTGVGISKTDITSQNLPLPVADYLAESTEERLVMYADKFHSKNDPPCFNTHSYYRASLLRFGADKQTAFDALTAEFGEPDLDPLIARYGHIVQT